MEESKDLTDRICNNELQGEVPYPMFYINFFWENEWLKFGGVLFYFYSILNLMLHELIFCIFE